MNDPVPHYTTRDRLAIEVHADRRLLGLAAARAAAAYLRDTIAEQGAARVVFACAPSQDEFLAALVEPAACGIAVEWSRVTVFHMDDYVGLTAEHPQSFRHYLQRHLLDRVSVAAFHPLAGEQDELAETCRVYGALLTERPIDLICAGIGENGHLAFNDPPVADFDDPETVKVVELDAACRQQQVNDGCFQDLEDVPAQALTLTVPVFRRARRLSLHVPGPRKAPAVKATLRDSIAPACPASVIRTHPQATLYLDRASAQQLG